MIKYIPIRKRTWLIILSKKLSWPQLTRGSLGCDTELFFIVCIDQMSHAINIPHTNQVNINLINKNICNQGYVIMAFTCMIYLVGVCGLSVVCVHQLTCFIGVQFQIVGVVRSMVSRTVWKYHCQNCWQNPEALAKTHFSSIYTNLFVAKVIRLRSENSGAKPDKMLASQVSPFRSVWSIVRDRRT